MSRISCNKETIYHGAVKQKRNQRERHAFFCQNHTVDPPIPLKEWGDLFQNAVIAKKNIDKKVLLNQIEKYYPQPPKLEHPPESETETQKSC